MDADLFGVRGSEVLTVAVSLGGSEALSSSLFTGSEVPTTAFLSTTPTDHSLLCHDAQWSIST